MNRTILATSAMTLVLSLAAQVEAAPTSHGLQGGAHHAGHPGTSSGDNIGRGGMATEGGRQLETAPRRSIFQIRQEERMSGGRFERGGIRNDPGGYSVGGVGAGNHRY